MSDVSDQSRRLRLITLVLAAACGLTVANLYYAQPLLDLIADDFGVSRGAAALVVTMTQIGYVLGLLFVLPLGDLLENRVLVVRTLIGTCAALVLTGVAPDFGVFLAASVLVGLSSVVAQILVPLAAHLAPAGQEGRYVGRVMSGLLLGILLARAASSVMAQAAGWRTIFFVSAGLMLVLAVVIWRVLPIHRPPVDHSYRELLASVGSLARHEPVLRRLALCHATAFGAFSAFWTAVAYELISRHGFSQAQIGLFALVGAAGAAAAPVGGWLADHGYGRRGRAVVLVLAAASMALAGFGAGSVAVLAVAAVLLDLAVQSHQVMAQQVLYQLHPTARARSTTVYMSTVFTTAAVCSALSGALYDAYGWTAVTILAGALPLAGLVLWATGRTTAPDRPSRGQYSDSVAATNAEPDWLICQVRTSLPSFATSFSRKTTPGSPAQPCPQTIAGTPSRSIVNLASPMNCASSNGAAPLTSSTAYGRPDETASADEKVMKGPHRWLRRIVLLHKSVPADEVLTISRCGIVEGMRLRCRRSAAARAA